ncbi:hypothetical protein J0X19_07930 [Hymenobacter sp. BT186]|uniref:Uncharacterized protein n=1 Tax=Hymenobacter telluris TaxID=2816474 RepID=A0A939EUP8_9BACT|nr:hypothetical protein [Hymenobacter telluris]MBO0357870.1 hypothetical protein [Hymenobacter telluris]MBW3373897.1 hypothetical protein [Hymenobacter norwichensis]
MKKKTAYLLLPALAGLLVGFAPASLHFPEATTPTAALPNRAPLAAPAVQGWFFRAVSGYPAAIAFEPVVLFENGEYYEVGEEPLESLNVPQSKSKRPMAWGTWQLKGQTYLLTNYKKQLSDYQLGSGNWFPAYAYTGAVKLKKGYEKVSGGNYGNGTNALSISKINFPDATHFTEGFNAGISTPNAAAGRTRNANGTYKLHGNTLELTYSDGRVVKKSFALGAKGAPARPTADIIFIGGDAYTDTE